MTECTNLNVRVNESQTLAQLLAEREAERLAQLDDDLLTIAKNGEAVGLLRAAGFATRMDRYNATFIELRVEVGDLPRVHKVLGRLKKLLCDLDDAKKKTVRVVLVPDKYPNVRVSYLRKLKKEARCRIVRKRVTRARLVCEV